MIFTKRILAYALGMPALILALILALAYWADAAFPLDMSRLEDFSPQIVDRNGATVHLFLNHEEHWRLPMAVTELPLHYRAMLVAYEDKRFDRHHGVDFWAIARATVSNLRHGRVVSGASTLSMQTVRLLQPRPRTLKSKIIEALRAWQLEHHYSKDEILAMYLQLAPMGGNVQGLRMAAQRYFGKAPAQLNLSESAWLIALPQAPLRHDALRDPQRAQAARDKVLQRAFAAGIFDAATLQRSLAEPLRLNVQKIPRHAPHWCAMLRRKQPDVHVIASDLDLSLQSTLEHLLAVQVQRQASSNNLAAAILENNGKMRAYLASADFFNVARQGQVDVLQALRSPGSALKPFITLYALERLGYQPTTTIDDTPILRGDYRPHNYDRRYSGRISLAEALRDSRNIPAVRLLAELGPDDFAADMARFGVQLHVPQGSAYTTAIALGGVGVRATELLEAYRRLSLCAQGKTLEQGAVMNVSTRSCWQLRFMLEHHRYPYELPAEWAVKTGTSYGWRDRWIYAFNDRFTLLLWLGRADAAYSERRSSGEELIPLLAAIIDLLPSTPKRPPQDDMMLLPPAPQVAHSGGQEGFIITQPQDRAVIFWQTGQAIRLEIQGGTPPFRWWVNGEEQEKHEEARWHWWPANAGFYQVEISDAQGEQQEVHLRLRSQLTPPVHRLHVVPMKKKNEEVRREQEMDTCCLAW